MRLKDYTFPLDMPLVREKNVFLYSFMIIPMFIDDELNQCSIDYALENNLPILVVKEKESENEFYDVGVIGTIMKKVMLPDDKVKILFQGLASGQIEDIKAGDKGTATILATTSIIKMKPYKKDRIEIIVKTLKDYLINFAKISGNLPHDLLKSLLDTEDPSRLAELVASLY